MKTLKLYIILYISSLCLSSCLDIQDSYDYEPANIDNNVYMNTWEFIQSRPDAFSSLQTANECS